MNLSTQSAWPCGFLYFVGITTTYPWGWGHSIILFSLLAPLRKCRYRVSGGQALLNLEDLIRWSPAKEFYRKGKNTALEGVIEVTFRTLDPDVMRFRHDPLVGIGIFYLPIKSQTLNRCRAVKWLMVVQQPIVKFNKYTAYEYILIISEHQSTKLVSPVLFNLCTE